MLKASYPLVSLSFWAIPLLCSTTTTTTTPAAAAAAAAGRQVGGGVGGQGKIVRRRTQFPEPCC